MKNKLLVLSTGFAMFSMFFGSGNLVFPLAVGQASEGNFLLAALGIILTGVVVPFLGVGTMMLFQGDYRCFFSTMGKPAAFWIPLVCLSLMGPFGVIGRCIAVSHGSFSLLVPNVSIVYFSLAFCFAILLITVRKNQIVSVVGAYLTPFLLGLLVLLTFCGIWQGQFPTEAPDKKIEALKQGFFQGYQTMDLLAAFFFSAFIINHLLKREEKCVVQSGTMKVFLLSSLLGAALLSAVYMGLVALGSIYSADLVSFPSTEYLAVIASKALGPMAGPVVCATVILACLTTSVVLTTLFSDFLRQEVAQKKMPEWAAMLATLSIAFFVSTLEFNGIASFLGPILEMMYPAMITLTIVNLASKLAGTPRLKWPVAATFLIKAFCF